MLAFATLYLTTLTILALVIRRAPEGWEDENGFHHGRQTFNDTPGSLANRDALPDALRDPFNHAPGDS